MKFITWPTAPSFGCSFSGFSSSACNQPKEHGVLFHGTQLTWDMSIQIYTTLARELNIVVSGPVVLRTHWKPSCSVPSWSFHIKKYQKSKLKTIFWGQCHISAGKHRPFFLGRGAVFSLTFCLGGSSGDHSIDESIWVIACICNMNLPMATHHPWCCWWKKSCNSCYGKHPIIYRVSYMSGGAGLLPATVSCIILHNMSVLKLCLLKSQLTKPERYILKY